MTPTSHAMTALLVIPPPFDRAADTRPATSPGRSGSYHIRADRHKRRVVRPGRQHGRVTAWPYYLFAIAAGAMLPIQFGINAQLASWVGSPLRATLVSFVVGAAVLLVATLVFARGWPGTEKLGAAPWWVWLGGFLGAFYVLGSVVTAPKLGAAALFAFILAGQAVASLAVDHFGWVGFDENPITPGRLLGMALVAAGVAAVRFL